MTEAKKSGQTNRQLSRARAAKNDEFYTRRETVEDELWHYRAHFAGKTVYCNCDDPKVSEFYKYFRDEFHQMRLRRLIATCYKSRNPDMFSRHDEEPAVYIEYDGGDSEVRSFLESDGDFRSEECLALLRRADIVCTNPPFSLFRDYVSQLIAEDKKFLVIGNFNAVSFKEIFRMIMAEKLWLGLKKLSGGMLFNVPAKHAEFLVANKKEGGAYKIVNGKVLGVSSAVWFTNLDHKKRHENFPLTARYVGNESAYPKYDNYDAIEVGPVADIPCDYAGVMGVTTTFLEQYNPEQFELIGTDYQVHTGLLKRLANPGWKGKLDRGYVGGKRLYSRLLIRNKKPL